MTPRTVSRGRLYIYFSFPNEETEAPKTEFLLARIVKHIGHCVGNAVDTMGNERNTALP